MNLVPTYLLKSPQRMLDLVSKRQEALADNIANMHTPGYKRRDVNFSQYLSDNTVSKLESKITEKYGPSPVMGAGLGGANKTTEEELALMQENYMLYNVAVRQLSSTITQIKTAMNVSANS